ncbi:unnamed protein product, partial [Laminaria digitata]
HPPLVAGGGLGHLATRAVAQDCRSCVVRGFIYFFVLTTPSPLRAGGGLGALATHAVVQVCVVCFGVLPLGDTFLPSRPGWGFCCTTFFNAFVDTFLPCPARPLLVISLGFSVWDVCPVPCG